MKIAKKTQVQKSFRIYSDIERDLDIISSVTGRSQNELVNVALGELIRDNKTYILDEIVFEHYCNQIENGNDEPEPFELGRLIVKFDCSRVESIKVTYILISEEGNEEHSEEFNYYSDELEKYLLYLGRLIDVSSPDVKEYLDNRTNYANYFNVKKK